MAGSLIARPQPPTFLHTYSWQLGDPAALVAHGAAPHRTSGVRSTSRANATPSRTCSARIHIRIAEQWMHLKVTDDGPRR